MMDDFSVDMFFVVRKPDGEKVVEFSGSILTDDTISAIIDDVAVELNEKGFMMNRANLVHEVVEQYMNSLLDNPEVVRSALECYFEGFNNDELQSVLNGFEGVL